jgi:hypothetical protein
LRPCLEFQGWALLPHGDLIRTTPGLLPKAAYGTVLLRLQAWVANFLMQEQQTPIPSAPSTTASGNQVSGEGFVPAGKGSPGIDRADRLPNWLQQAERFLRVIVRMYLGLLVCCAPWYPPAWDANPLFSSSPGLTAFITNGAVRGVVSGLGLLNLWIALRDALRGSAEPGSSGSR